MGNIKQKGILRKNQKGKLKMKNTVMEINYAFVGFIGRLDMADTRIDQVTSKLQLSFLIFPMSSLILD